MKNLPEKIYLNIELDSQCDDYNELDTDEITWSWQQQFKDDVPYILESLIPEYAKDEALKFANYLTNTVIAGRTMTKLWNDYKFNTSKNELKNT